MDRDTRGSDGQRLNGLDHLRAAAIAYVFLYHYSTAFAHPMWLERVGEFGWTGVDLFFVLSGYLVGGQLLRVTAVGDRIATGEFYIKRFFRIVPAYLLVVSIYFLFPGFREQHNIAPLWKFLTFTTNIGLDLKGGKAFSHAWSLCVEEHFYIVMPLLIAALSVRSWERRGIWIGVAVLVGGLILRAGSWLLLFHPTGNDPAWWEWVYYPTYNRLDGLLVGVSAAAVRYFNEPLWVWLTHRWKLLMGLGLVLLCCAFGADF